MAALWRRGPAVGVPCDQRSGVYRTMLRAQPALDEHLLLSLHAVNSTGGELRLKHLLRSDRWSSSKSSSNSPDRPSVRWLRSVSACTSKGRANLKRDHSKNNNSTGYKSPSVNLHLDSETWQGLLGELLLHSLRWHWPPQSPQAPLSRQELARLADFQPYIFVSFHNREKRSD